MTKQEAADKLRTEYRTRWGSTKLTHEIDSGNSMMFLGIGIVLLSKNGLLIPDDTHNFYSAVRACQKQPGLISRSPGSTLMQQHDDYAGVLAGCRHLGITDIPREIYEYGQSHCWNFNDQGRGFSLKAQRQGGEVAVYKIAAGHRPNFLEGGWLATGLYKSKAGLVTWLRIEAMGLDRMPTLSRKAAESWLRGWRHQGELAWHIAQYFQDVNHPFHALSEGLVV